VEHFFLICLVIEQITNATKIRCKLNFAALTILLWWLHQLAAIASDLSNVEPIKFVIFLGVYLLLIVHFIVTKPAAEKLIASIALLLASTFVMLAPKLRVNLIIVKFVHLTVQIISNFI